MTGRLLRAARNAILALALFYSLALVGLYALQRHLIFDPSQRAPTPAEAGFADVAEQALTAADGTRIQLWYAPARNDLPTVLFFHGKGGEIADRHDRWVAYRTAGLGVAFLSYRGYGGSAGSPSEAGLHLDADAAYDWLLAQGVTAERLVIVGESLGTGVAVRLAADRQAAALILEAPYTSLADVAQRRFPWVPARWLIRDPFPSLDRIARVSEPLLILHGTRDTRVPARMGLDLWNAAPGPKMFVPLPDTGHVDLFGPKVWAREIRFMTEPLT